MFQSIIFSSYQLLWVMLLCIRFVVKYRKDKLQSGIAVISTWITHIFIPGVSKNVTLLDSLPNKMMKYVKPFREIVICTGVAEGLIFHKKS